MAVTDFENDCIYIMDTTGSVIRTIGKSGKGNGMFNGPEGVAFNKQGFLYIVDSGNSRVQKLSLQGKFVLSFGKEGSYEGDFSKPTDVAVLHHKVYVVDRGNRRISVFDEYGNYMKSILSGELEIPRGVTVHGDSLLISDNVKGLLFYNTKSQKKQWLKKWKKNRSFNKLMSAVTDRDGFLYCLDYNYQALFTFSPKQLVYSNLDIEVTSVDIQKFPIVAFYMTVRSSQGSPLYGLKQSNFKVIEDGVVMRNPFVNYLRRLRPSVSMVFCMDRSEKSKAYTNDYPWAADFILKKMRVNDSVKVVNFHKNIWDGSSFDWSRRRTIRTMKKFRTTSKEKAIGKVLYNAISDVLPRLNRRAVLLFTDGSVSNESFQRYSADYIVEYAKAHYIPIYIISIKKPTYLSY